MNAVQIPTFDDVRRAVGRIRPHAHRTPVVTSRAVDERAGARVFFKCENLQRVGAFKFRGACNAVMCLSEEEAVRGVATHSSGNHAQALALAAHLRGVAAHIVMPENAPAVKRAAVAGYGARIIPCEPTLASRESTLAQVVTETGATFVHPYDDPRVIAGQGTVALELLEEVPDLDTLLAPVGGGGLLSGTAITAAALSPATRVLGAEPEAADDAHRSLVADRLIPSKDPITICDGLRTSLSERTFAVIRRHVPEIPTVSEAAVLEAMRFFIERTKLLIEPSSAVPVSVVLDRRVGGGRIGVILSGGNVDLSSLFEALGR